ncbi:MAG: hypothetical protein ACOYU5_00465 [Stygiobacter sp.]
MYKDIIIRIVGIIFLAASILSYCFLEMHKFTYFIIGVVVVLGLGSLLM